MPISTLRDRLEEGLLRFLWNEWSQLGVLGRVERPSPWAQDLEALLVMSFEVARADPRLFDEILDWLATNEHLMSVRRLRTLGGAAPEPSQTAAVVAWLARHRPKVRFSGRPGEALTPQEARRLFFDDGFPIRSVDEAFAEQGWERSAVGPSGKSSAPDLRAPVAFGLRLRRMFGPGARAEVVRHLLTTDAPRSTVAVITRSAAFTRRNVQEALNELTDASLVSQARLGNEVRYGIDRPLWQALLEVEGFPKAVDWIPLLAALTRMLVWLRAEAVDERSEYLQASSARKLLDDVRPDLEWAGIAVRAVRADEALGELEAVIAEALGVFGVAG
jgi:hypothetical protein